MDNRSFLRNFSLLFLIFFVYSFTIATAQVVDKTRLEFYEDNIKAKQMGMAVSANANHAAFLFDNSTLRVFDLIRSKFIKEMPLEFNEIGEIRFAQDNMHIIVIEKYRMRILDWKTGEVKVTESYTDEIKVADVSPTENVFAIASASLVEIWDASTQSKIRTITFKNQVFSLSFSPVSTEILIYPKVSMVQVYGKKNQTYIYNYKTGTLVRSLPKVWMAIYDNSGDKVFGYRIVSVQKKGTTIGGMATGMIYYDLGAATHDLIHRLESSSEKGSDVGFYTKMVQMENKVVATGGYRGFSVVDLSGGGRIFTTKKTKKERSSSKMGFAKDYMAQAVFKISSDKVLVNAYGDNINQVYSVSQNKIVGYIFTDGDGDFAVVSRDGRFDGTSRSSEKLYWTSRTSSKKTSLESTFARGFTPNLLSELVQNNVEIAEFDIESELEGLPAIQITSFNNTSVSQEEIPEFSSNQKLVTITVSVTENLSNVAQLKLFQNNKLVGLEENPQGSSITFEASLTNTFGVNNFFYTVATSKSGIDSEKQKLVVAYEGKTDTKPRLFLVTVGIDQYRNPRYNLNYAIADANAFKDVLASGANQLFEEIIQIDIRDADFTKSEILSTMEKIQQKANEQDMLVFYYAGHGVMSQGTSREIEFFFVPHDVTQLYGKDDILFEKAISASEMKEISRKINAQKQVFILDACQSAGALDAMARRGAAEERAIAQLARSTGTFWITATGSEQFATEFESLGHGIFTYAVIEGLQGKADGLNPDKSITVRELTAYIESRVPELSEEYKGKLQFPSSYSFGNDFPLVVYE